MMTHAQDPLLRVLERKPPRRGLARFPVIVFAMLITGCTSTTTINRDDGTSPQVRIFVWQEQRWQELENHADVHYQNRSDSELQVVCAVYDPQGARSADLRVSDPTVDTARCGGVNYPGNYPVAGLPAPNQSSGWISPTETKTSTGATLLLSGSLELATNPPNISGTCTPAHNSVISIRCQGKNYSASPGNSTTDKFLDIQFKTLSP